jgi:hypothetical protein
MDGDMCAHYGPLGSVGAHSTPYLDVVSAISPTALTDGTIGGSFSVVVEPPGYIWYAPGFSGLDFCSGDWVTKIANMVVCYYPCAGACCFPETGVCREDVLPCDCMSYGGRFWCDRRCEDLNAPCGDVGACCDIQTGECVDGVLQAKCGGEHHVGLPCVELAPVCGDPGCRCD